MHTDVCLLCRACGLRLSSTYADSCCCPARPLAPATAPDTRCTCVSVTHTTSHSDMLWSETFSCIVFAPDTFCCGPAMQLQLQLLLQLLLWSPNFWITVWLLVYLLCLAQVCLPLPARCVCLCICAECMAVFSIII